MAWLRVMISKLSGLFRRDRFEQQLDDEVRAHLEMLAEENRRRGMAPEQARDAAMREFGNVSLMKEECRDTWGVRFINELGQDVRYGLRQLRRNPGFTVVAVLTLALGIGANTSLFSVVNELFLRPLPVNNPEQLVVLAAREKGLPGVRDISYPDFLDYRTDTNAFSGIAGYDIGLDGLAADHWAKRVVVSYVTGNYFSMLQLQPALGRLIQPGEGGTPGSDPVVVLGYSFWKRQFAGDPQIVGKVVHVNGRPETIVGVTPKTFHGTKAWVETDAYLPISQMTQEGSSFRTSRGSRGDGGFTVLARLRPGMSIPRARASLEVIAQQLEQQHPRTDRNMSVEVYPEPLARPQADAARQAPPVVAAFMFLALIVLVVACVNLANMLETRAISREGEMAVRSALGAGRSRLARQCVTESVLLALLGGAAGIVLSELISRPLSLICTPVDISLFKLNFQPDWRVFAYAFGVTLLAGIAMGMVPARRAWRSNLNSVMHEAGRALSGGRSRHRARNGLIIAQVAASTVLLVAAGLFIRSLRAVRDANLGFNPHHVLNLGMDISELGYKEPEGREFYQELLGRVRALPGVESAGYVYSTPFYHNRLGSFVWLEDRPILSGHRPPSVFYNIVTPSIFKTLQIPILRGRDFGATDTRTSPKVAIVSQAMAQRFWPGRNPVGEHFSIGGPRGPWVQVIGVAGDAQFVGPTTPRKAPYFFLPLSQNYSPALALQVRTPLFPTAIAHEVEQQIRGLAPGLPVFDVRSQEEALNGATGYFLFIVGSEVATGLGILGLLLTIVGVYGVVSYAARLRTHEIGLRMALGAQRGDVLKLVVGQGSKFALIGVAIGVTCALGLARFLSSLVYGVKPTDPLTFVAVSLILIMAALLACYIPARRAASVDPMEALRYE